MKPLRIYAILTIIFAVGLLFSCDEGIKNNDARWYPPEATNQNTVEKREMNLTGHWVCRDFTDLVNVRKTVRGIRNRPFFLEIIFNPEFGDSALLITGYNNIMVPCKMEGRDSIILENTGKKNDLILYIAQDKQHLLLPDFLKVDEKSEDHNWVFVKTSSLNKNYTTHLNSHINKSMLGGTYGKGNKQITFNANGKIEGWENFSEYDVCYGGKCFMLTRSPLDIVTLKHGGVATPYAFWLKTNDSLYFYKLEKINTDTSYNYQPTEMAFAFKKIN